MFRWFWLSALCSICLVWPFTANAAEAKDRERQAASAAFFTNGLVCQIHLEISPAAIESLKTDKRKFVRITVKDGERIFQQVGAHLKGMGSFRPLEEKPSFTLKFNEFSAGQRFHGLTKIALNNSVQDATYIKEPLCTSLFRDAGVPAARVSHARVWLNGRYLGLYVLVEGLSKDFLKLNFKNCNGNLYEGYVQDLDEDLKIDNGEDKVRADLGRLLQAAREADPAVRWQQLQKALDVDRFLSMMAGEILMAHWDGYWMNHNNYRLYHDTSHQRMVMIPYGLDSMFQQPAMPLQPKQQTLLTQAVLQTPEGQRRYRERLAELHAGVCKAEILHRRVDEIASRIRPALPHDGLDALQAWEQQVAGLHENIAARMKFISQELASTAPH